MKFANKKLAIVLVMSMLLAACCFPIYSQAFTNSNSKKSLRYIHLNSYDGNDNNDGLTKETSVKTFDKAKTLINDGDIILIDNNFEITKDEKWDLSDKPNSKLQRNAGGDMIVIEGNHTLTLSNIVLDGKAYRKDIDIEHCNSIISLGKSAGTEKNGAKLVLNTGSILENNNAPQLQGNAIAGYSYNTIIMNDDSIIRNNGIERGAQFGGAISLENHGNFIMHDGIIENNHAVRGGGVSLIASSMEMNGGIIKNNTANCKDTYQGHYGGGIYLSNFQDWSSVGDNYSREISGKASFTMNGGTILNNKATYKASNGDNGKGGAIATYPAFYAGYEKDPIITVDIKNGDIIGNEAIDGGAISAYFEAVKVNVSNANIKGNIAKSQGGAIYGVFNAEINLADSVISENKAAVGAGAYLYASDMNMDSGKIINNNATYNGGGIYIDHPSWRDKVATCTLLGGIVKSNTAAKGLGSDGIYQNSKLRIGKSVLIDKDNDVYLPSGRIIDAIKPLDKITNKTRVSITSEDCVIENSENPGTRLVKYHEEAGGVKAAKIAEEKQLYVPSKYMKEDLVIGKSQATDQLDFMTYIKKNKYPVVYEFVSLTDGKKIPEEVNKLLPIDDDKYIDGATVTAIQLEKNELQVEDGTWKFEGYDEKNKVASADILDENGNIKFIGKWKFEKKETPIQKPDNPTNKPDTPIVNPDNPSNTDHPTDNEETPKQKVPDKDEPKTGDETAPMMLVALLIASSAGLYVLRKKEK